MIAPKWAAGKAWSVPAHRPEEPRRLHEGVMLLPDISLFRPFSARHQPHCRLIFGSWFQTVRFGWNFGISQPPSPPGFMAEPDHLLTIGRQSSAVRCRPPWDACDPPNTGPSTRTRALVARFLSFGGSFVFGVLWLDTAGACGQCAPRSGAAVPPDPAPLVSGSQVWMITFLEFEKPVADLQGKVQELRALGESGNAVAIGEEIAKLEAKAAQALADIYAKLTPWQKTQVARHPDRPHFVDYAERLFTDFTPLAGDRKFGEDKAVLAGFGRFRDRPVAIVGQEKGHDTETRLKHNFGMARPEGYRKAIRIMELAERFDLPLITLVDTAGAFPGLEAEERGQAEAIARSTEAALALAAPSVSVIIGEGGSGGAIAIATASRVLMLEHSIYSVISPEGAASILWRDATRAQDAATNMKITAQDLYRFGVIDQIVSEPLGGAHRDPNVAIDAVGDAIAASLASLSGLSGADLKRQRREKFLAIGRSL